ncbi:DgyrCDS12973 [Dimorphilus gyrociliatus]|uniref:Tetraspanin n=1 Tax=Dimorphilus gyrociliatus TaxID=2664684 RepID=A0A7I8W9D1_9ANNE|nr:DgyrCDS12973 [Dimorphilus gyrociliatus]
MSKIDCTATIIKLLLFFSNVFFWIVGILVIGFGIWVIQQESELLGDNADTEVYKIVYSVTIVIILVGVIVFIVAFVGCIGTIRENITILNVFIGLLIAEVVVELSLIVVGFSLYETIKDEVIDSLKDTLVYYLDSPSIRDLIDTFQQAFLCCGVSTKGYKDWKVNEYYGCKENNPFYLACSVPWTCCIGAKDDQETMINRMCGKGVLEDKSENIGAIYTEGCIDAVHNKLKSNLSIVLGMVTGVFFLQIIGIFLAFLLRVTIKSNQSEINRPTNNSEEDNE